MTQDEIIEMAKESGLIVNSPHLMPHDHVLRGIEAFAKLVAAKEREACAKVCEYYAGTFNAHRIGECADAIRAMGQA